MKKMDVHKLDRMKELLKEEETFPLEYTFKFIVPTAKLSEILSFFPNDENIETKPSSKGSYISVTVNRMVQSADEVVKTYEVVSVIDGIISL